MQALKIRYKDAVEYEIVDDPAKEAYFVFGVRKSGSSILNSIMHALADFNGIRYVDVAGLLFEKGLRVPQWQADAELANIIHRGNLYGGFRNFPIGFQSHPLYLQGKKVLLVRDPRDALVSEYFSNAYSHSLPAGGEMKEEMEALRQAALRTQIADYVLKMAPQMKRTLREYAPLLKDKNLLLLKYEDSILKKRQMMDEVCRFFGWNLTDQHAANILGWADVIPSEERPKEFVRKVTPGDHLDKLTPAMIGQLNDMLKDEMSMLGYR